jgi:hypothetical protein
MSKNTSIVVCGKKYDIGTRVVPWNESHGLNAYDKSKHTYKVNNRKTGKTKTITVSGVRYSKRSWRKKPTLEQLQSIVNQFFLHHSGLYRAKDTFNVLHNQRRLSVHFILDDNGVLYQTLDLKEKAWHGGKNNPQSVGIEIDSRAHANRFPTAYDAAHQKKYGVGPRRIRIDRIGGRWIKGYEYNDKQYAALIRLGIGLKSIFPKMKGNGGVYMDFPRNSKGRVVTSKLAKPLAHRGLICHYNNSSTKNDPISLDHYRVSRGILLNNSSQPSSFLKTDTWLDRQEWLSAVGYDPGDIDGDFGPKTKAALQKLQRDSGLTPDGVWGQRSGYMLDLVTKEKGVR